MPIHTTDTRWILETAHTAYVLALNPQGLLTHCYWGPALPFPEDYPPPLVAPGWASFNGPGELVQEEYPANGGGLKYVEPCLKTTFSDGVRDCLLAFASAETLPGPAPELVIHLHDAHYPLQVDLHYRLHEALDLIERWASLHNAGAEAITLDRVLSAQWHLPYGGQYYLSHLSGRWAGEFELQRTPLDPGLKVLESRRLTTSHHHNPWFALDRGAADEGSGEVWYGALAWSGNWKISAEVTSFASTRLSTGLNDWDFAWRLEAGETFTTPAAIAGYTQGGFGAASRSLHDFVRSRLPHGPAPHKVLYNSWEATTFAVDRDSQARLAELAAAMGVELFVMDDGWFQGRNWDNAGLGDWWPDPAKFPTGLGPLIRRVNELGMDFGLWIEPEMVNPDSQLYRSHPDWVIHFPTRPRSEARNQLILNLARPDVQDYLIETLDRLLTENNIRFIKWDMNRNASEPGWPDAPGEPRELWVRYVQGVYRVWGTLAERHPEVVWQSCSGGGGRADLAILRLADQVWVSDNSEATSRLLIQEGFSQLFPAAAMEAWVTDAGADLLSLAFRFHVSMCGVLGIGGNLLAWSEAERQEAAGLVALYKEIRPVVQGGDLYRLRSPRRHPISALMYVAKDRSEAVLFAFRTHLGEFLPHGALASRLARIQLAGLDPTARYEVEGFPTARSGAAWMQDGLTVELGNFDSTVRRMRRVS